MARRFNDLNQRMVNALKANATIESLMAETNKDEALRNYVKWLTYQNKLDHKRSANSTRQLKGVVKKNIVPFGMEISTGDAIQVPISKRTSEFLDGTGSGIKAAAQHQTLATGKMAYPGRGWYKPAKAIFRSKGTTQNTVSGTQNKITKQEYKTYFDSNNQGYVVPFGKTGTEKEIDRRQTMQIAIAVAFPANSGGYGLSFQSEKIILIPARGT